MLTASNILRGAFINDVMLGSPKKLTLLVNTLYEVVSKIVIFGWGPEVTKYLNLPEVINGI